MCFCFCHDNLGYALDFGDQFVFCNFRTARRQLIRALPRVNALYIDYIHGKPLSYIKYLANSDSIMSFSDDDFGPLRPDEILSIQAFSWFERFVKTFPEKVQILRRKALGEFLTMQSMRYIVRCCKSLWRSRGDKQFAMINDLMRVSASKEGYGGAATRY